MHQWYLRGASLVTTACYILHCCFSFSFLSIVQASPAKWEKQKFIVTAYYSPLPNQSFYLRWSYEADKRLNGNGTHGASGKAVYPGMIAAPKIYEFGTKIELIGVWIGTVDDRGGAIVWSGVNGYEYDRLDIWMWSGDEWLKRALNWGKRVVEWKVYSGKEAKEKKGTIPIYNFPIGEVFKKVLSTKDNVKAVETGEKQIKSSSENDRIKRYQYALKELGYHHGEIDGMLSLQFQSEILQFQQDAGLEMNGKISKQTAEKINALIRMLNETKQLQSSIEQAILEEKDSSRSTVQSFTGIYDGSIGSHVRELQKHLKTLGYFQEKDTGIFWPKTKKALIAYQIDRNIIKNVSDNTAWVLTWDTILELEKDFIEKIDTKLIRDTL